MLDACHNQHTELAEILLSAGANVNAGEMALLSVMRKCAALLNALNIQPLTDIQQLVFPGPPSCSSHGPSCSLLFLQFEMPSHGMPVISTAANMLSLHQCSVVSSVDGMLCLGIFSYSESLPCPVLLSLANNDGDRPLMIAAKKGNEELVQMLIKSGANVNLSDNEGWTPLIAAAHKGHKEVCKILLDAGANKGLTTSVKPATPIVSHLLYVLVLWRV